jgi:FG-GAP-like repeat/PQQ-like domain
VGTVGTGGLPTSVKVADVNRDGRQDVLVSTNGSTQGRVYLGNGAGGMTPSATLITMTGSTTTTDIAVVDVDSDGILDVMIADITAAPAINTGLYGFRGNGDGTFQVSVEFATQDFGSLAVADLDRNGRDDLALTEASNASPALLTATLSGTFFAPFFSGSFGIGVNNNPLPQFNSVATGHFDDDGLPDVAVADSTRVQIFLGLGTGQVTSAGQFLLGGGALSLQAGDVNLDGNLDLVFITPFPTGSVGVMLGDGAGAFSPPTLATFPTTADGVAVALGDFNADGRLDIAAANKVGRNVAILLNELESSCAGASFGPAARGFLAMEPRALAIGDFDNDGARDVVAASPSVNQVTVLRGRNAPGIPSGPTFAPGFNPETSLLGFSNPRGLALARFDTDGFLDLAVANAGSGQVSVFQGNAGGFTFQGTVGVGASPVAVGTGDFNNDNRQDLAVVNQSANNVSIRLGNGDGTFTGAPDVAVGSTPSAVAIADFNQDGRPDLVVSNQGSSNLSILLGNGDGTFSAGIPLGTGAPPIAVVVTRLNGDALPDIAVAVSSPIDSVRTFLATGFGIFGPPTDYFVGSNLQSLATGDFTQDGRPDLLAGRSVGTLGHVEVTGQPAVDYAAQRVYVASRAWGGVPDNNTLWCVNLADGTSCWAKSYGDIETGVSLQNDRLFVGTNAGTVLALRKSDGDPAWGAPLPTGDGRVRGYIATDRLTGDIYFSTNARVWRVDADGASASTIWSIPFTAPSTPVFAPGDSVVYVGGVGSLFKLNVVGGSGAGSFLLGEGTSKVGSPTLDLRNGFAYVGTEAGIVYAVRIP